MSESKEGRRVLILPVEGELGNAIQEFRERIDPTQAVRIPPHLTLAYWAGVEDADALEKQVRHALPHPVTITLGALDVLIGRQMTHIVSVEESSELDAARERLFDETHITLPEQRHTWAWHISVRRYATESQLPGSGMLSRKTSGSPLEIRTVMWAELRDGKYEPVNVWNL